LESWTDTGCRTYDWTNGSRIVKSGDLLTLEENQKIAGSSIQLVDCASNFMHCAGASVPEALKAVTETPARMLGLQGVKGELVHDADADLVVLGMEGENEDARFFVEQVWKFGNLVFEKKRVWVCGDEDKWVGHHCQIWLVCISLSQPSIFGGILYVSKHHRLDQ
jgi:hypothetical protein